MNTFTILGYYNGDLIAEECGVEENQLANFIKELESEGFQCEVVEE